MQTSMQTDDHSSHDELSSGILPNSFVSKSDTTASSHCKPACLLDLFAGARAPVFSALHEKSFHCIEPIDKINGISHDILDDSVFEAVLRLASSTLVSVSLAAPYCSKRSRATLFPGGPQPVRTPLEPAGCMTNTLQQA